MPDHSTDGVTIVTPTFEKHYVQFSRLVESVARFCLDVEAVTMVVVVERVNVDLFRSVFETFPTVRNRIVATEDVLSDFGSVEVPSAFLRRAGKFTFQTVKKFGGLMRAETHWSLVLDSESLFHKPFRALELRDNYARQKYVFYTRTEPRGETWKDSTGYDVTRNAGAALSVPAGDRWYMEYFHWFYEADKLRDLVQNKLGSAFFDVVRNTEAGKTDFFENVLWYVYLETYHGDEYTFYDFKQLLEEHLSPEISARFDLSELPFSLFGNEYLLNILRPSEIGCIRRLFDRFKLPFVRLEPPYFDHRYLDELNSLPTFVATISSHHLTWLRKKVAVCVSGEFRHVVHRTPEHHVRHLMGFLSGVSCDIYVHGWSNSSEPLIVDALKPRAYLFEPRPDFAELAASIGNVEPRIKPGRDEGSLAMFYSIEKCFELIKENRDEYDYVLRIRPDLYIEASLKEIMVKISDEGDFLPNAIYVPRQFHSKGINDQVALGPIDKMATYARTLSYVRENIGSLFFNPETVLLRNLLENGVEIALVDMPYGLMRDSPYRIATVYKAWESQQHVWWSRTDRLPVFQDVSAFFRDKLHAVEALMCGRVPTVCLATGPWDTGGRDVTIRARAADWDPARAGLAFFRRFGFYGLLPFVVEDGRIRATASGGRRYLFVFNEGARIVISEWRMQSGRLVNHRLDVPAEKGRAGPRLRGARVALAWAAYRTGRFVLVRALRIKARLRDRRDRIAAKRMAAATSSAALGQTLVAGRDAH